MFRRIVALLLPLVLPGLFAVQAQSPLDPIILINEGDLWSWSGSDQSLVQHTDWGLNSFPIGSPDGTRVAYWSAARIFKDWLATINGAGGFQPPTNIWILDIPSGQTFRVADQPIDVVWDGPQNPARYILRTFPSWSPDSRQLAWIELLIDTVSTTTAESGRSAQLVTYDLSDGTTQVLDTLSVSNELFSADLFNVQWGAPGIAVKFGNLDSSPSSELRVYDPSGTLLEQFELDEETLNQVFSARWISYEGQDYLFEPGGSSDTWLNWQTGELESLPGLPEMVSLSTPDGARFYVSGNDTWHLEFLGQAAIDLGDQIRPFGISREGQQVVYGRWEINPDTGFYAYTVIVQSSDELIEIGRYQNAQLVWGPTGWQIRP